MKNQHFSRLPILSATLALGLFLGLLPEGAPAATPPKTPAATTFTTYYSAPRGDDPPQEFNADLGALWALVTPAAPAPTADPELAQHHRELEGLVSEYRRQWLSTAMAFFAKIVPKGLPRTVVYPFGGVDLVTALAVFPEATDLTTISLEPAGEAAAMFSGSGRSLSTRLELFRKDFSFLFRAAFSRSDSLTTMTDHKIPGPILFALLALSIHGFEPVSLRYFRLDASGTIQYITDADVRKAAAAGDTHIWDSMELGFRRGSGGPLRVHRHIFADLSDERFAVDPSLLRYLATKGRVSAMTKAASYLLWDDGFSLIRKYLLDHMDWMISDSTGVPPSVAEAAGFEQLVYGHFSAAILKVDSGVQKEFRDLWKGQPKRPLPIRFGYPDHGTGENHLMVTRPRSGGDHTSPPTDR